MIENDYRNRYGQNPEFGFTEHSEEIEEAQRLRREKRNSSISPRAAKRREAMQDSDGTEKKKKSFFSIRNTVFGIVALVVCVVFVASGVNIFELRTSAAAEETALALKQEEKERLENEYAMINDLDYIETQAREKLGMIKPGEILYIFKDKEAEEK